MSKFIIELRGVEFENKGAELMLHSIIQRIREWDNSVVFVMSPSPKVPTEKRKKYLIFTKTQFVKYRINFTLLIDLLPAVFLKKYGYVKNSEINVIMDASGFAFGDKWGAEYASRRLGNHVKKWHRNKKIILLPQAFGPFDKKDLVKVMKKILNNVDLLFARDDKSFDYLNNIEKSDKIFKAPDFTNLVKHSIPSDFDINEHEVAIIPNYQMVNSTALSIQEYSAFLIQAISLVKASGKKPYFLIHEGQKDLDIANYVNNNLDFPINVIVYDNALDIKGVISTACFIICSRFHGVVSALTQGVPCITTSWSHKYEMLVDEYNVENSLIKDLKNYNLLEKLVFEYSDPIRNKELSTHLLLKAKFFKKESELMWQKVFTVLEN